MRGVFYRIGVAFDGIAGPNKALGEPESFEKVPSSSIAPPGESPVTE
jgi:hypothetical protein